MQDCYFGISNETRMRDSPKWAFPHVSENTTSLHRTRATRTSASRPLKALTGPLLIWSGLKGRIEGMHVTRQRRRCH